MVLIISIFHSFKISLLILIEILEKLFGMNNKMDSMTLSHVSHNSPGEVPHIPIFDRNRGDGRSECYKPLEIFESTIRGCMVQP